MANTSRNLTIGGLAVAGVLGTAIWLTSYTPKTYYAPATSGNVVIDGNAIRDTAGNKVTLHDRDTIKVRSGKYATLTIRNINAAVIIKNEGLVEVVGSVVPGQNWTLVSISNVHNIKLTGIDPTSSKYGFVFRDNNYQVFSVNGPEIDNVTFQGIRFDNIGNYVFRFENSFNRVYNGSDSTSSDNVRFLDIEVNRCAQLVAMPGNVGKDGPYGVFKDMEVARLSVSNCPTPGTIFHCGAALDYDVHDNIVTGINQNNNNHNGIFFLYGTGKFYQNWITNHQGNALRAWAYTIGTTPGTVEIYGNKVYNSRKYSAFELQTPAQANLIVPGKTTYANAKVHHNTVGRMNTSHDWDGQLLDLYDLAGGSLEYYNNLGFDLYASNQPWRSVTNMINNMSTVKISQRDNLYFPKAEDAVSDITLLTGKFSGIGADIIPQAGEPEVVEDSSLPVAESKCDTIYVYKRDTVYVPSGVRGSYTLTIGTDTVTLRKQ
jgi:hypothetical protein